MKHKFLLAALSTVALSCVSQAVGQDYDPYSWDPNSGGSSSGGGNYGSTGGNGSQGLFGASNFSYGFVAGSYYSFSFDDEAIDSANGFGIDLSVPVVDSLYLQASLIKALPENEDGDDLDYTQWELGAGIGLPLGSNFDIVIEGGLARQNISEELYEESIDGYGFYLAPGVRWKLNDVLELNGGLKYYSIDDYSDLGFEAKALIHLTPSISLEGNAHFGEIENHYGVGLRLSF